MGDPETGLQTNGGSRPGGRRVGISRKQGLREGFFGSRTWLISKNNLWLSSWIFHKLSHDRRVLRLVSQVAGSLTCDSTRDLGSEIGAHTCLWPCLLLCMPFHWVVYDWVLPFGLIPCTFPPHVHATDNKNMSSNLVGNGVWRVAMDHTRPPCAWYSYMPREIKSHILVTHCSLSMPYLLP